MKKLQYADTVLAELTSVLAQVDDAQAEQLIEKICQAQTVFLAGSGRSGLAGKAFAMRLGHLGKQAAVIGETMTPPFCPGDLLLACSGSGESGAQLVLAQKAKRLQGNVALVTIAPDSNIGRIADCILEIPAPSPKVTAERSASIQPMASLFEQSLLLTLDVLILKLMDRYGMDTDEMYRRHVNLE